MPCVTSSNASMAWVAPTMTAPDMVGSAGTDAIRFASSVRPACCLDPGTPMTACSMIACRGSRRNMINANGYNYYHGHCSRPLVNAPSKASVNINLPGLNQSPSIGGERRSAQGPGGQHLAVQRFDLVGHMGNRKAGADELQPRLHLAHSALGNDHEALHSVATGSGVG